MPPPGATAALHLPRCRPALRRTTSTPGLRRESKFRSCPEKTTRRGNHTRLLRASSRSALAMLLAAVRCMHLLVWSIPGTGNLAVSVTWVTCRETLFELRIKPFCFRRCVFLSTLYLPGMRAKKNTERVDAYAYSELGIQPKTPKNRRGSRDTDKDQSRKS